MRLLTEGLGFESQAGEEIVGKGGGMDVGVFDLGKIPDSVVGVASYKWGVRRAEKNLGKIILSNKYPTYSKFKEKV